MFRCPFYLRTPIMNALKKTLAVAVLAVLAACASSSSAPASGGPAAQAPAPATPAAAPGILSTAQADRGRNVFLASCSGCHASSEFQDTAFKYRWRTRTAGDLFDHVSATMPEDAPGSLAPGSYVEVVTYILRMNGFQATADGSVLDRDGLIAISLSSIAGS